MSDAVAVRTATAFCAMWSTIAGLALLAPGQNFQQAAYTGIRTLPVPEPLWGIFMLLIAGGLWVSVPSSHTRTNLNSLVAFFASLFWLMFGFVLTIGAATKGLTSANGIWDVVIGGVLMCIASLWPRFR